MRERRRRNLASSATAAIADSSRVQRLVPAGEATGSGGPRLWGGRANLRASHHRESSPFSMITLPGESTLFLTSSRRRRSDREEDLGAGGPRSRSSRTALGRPAPHSRSRSHRPTRDDPNRGVRRSGGPSSG